MNMLQRCISYLNHHGIRHSHSIHPKAYTAREVANAERMAAHNMAKTVVYSGDNGNGMLVLPADFVVSFPEVRRLLGLTEIRLTDESELASLFPGCELGAMPPLGTLFDLPVLMDEQLADGQFMAFNAGTHRDVIRVSVADFRKLVNPLVAAFAIRERAAVS
jgi:Ala-tRNA(Pro) deacylase